MELVFNSSEQVLSLLLYCCVKCDGVDLIGGENIEDHFA